MKILNQYSAVWIFALIVIAVGAFLMRRDPKWPQFLTLAILVLGLSTTWIILHPRQTTQVNNAAQVKASIGQGMPVLLEFQSPY